MVLFRGSGPSGELSWWGIVLGIVVPLGNGWALFLSGGELSLVGSCPRTLESFEVGVGWGNKHLPCYHRLAVYSVV